MVPKPISDDDTDREDSGITTDVSCSQSQADEQTDQQLDDLNQIALKSELEEAVDPEEAMEQNEDDASVSDSTDGATTQSVYEGKLTINIGSTTNTTVEEVIHSNGISREDHYIEYKFPLPSHNNHNHNSQHAPPVKAPNAIFSYIRCNLMKTDDNCTNLTNFVVVDEEDEFDGHNTDVDNNYVYECIKINKKNNAAAKINALEKSNSVDTALSLCSSSEMESLLEDIDTSSSIIDK